ncbi:preprotein translocase subunit YajC [uncultured Tyzzerella sp.]|uniref:preprotein translocase subunit YajC n=1 Tax=uncultured Tyzzerella sp. TaxID=2321398 RepID=UPI002943D644|nr:preprotein translocase subunit YajC [uncultured Tyzzerella sp.]
MNFTLLSHIITGGSEVATQAAEAGQATAPTTPPGGLGFFATLPGIIIYIVFIVLIFYFIGIRPQKKREKKMIELQSEIKIGDWVLLDSGIYGKVTDIADQVFIIEFGTNKGVLIPVLKQRVVSKGEPNLTSTTK